MGDTRILTYLDSDILRILWKGEDEIAQRAIEVIDDNDRIFASSMFSKIELIPKPIFNKRNDEVAFYEEFFNSVSVWAEINKVLVDKAIIEAGRIDLTPIDALHIAAAASMGVDEFITGEKDTSPMHRTSMVAVRTIRT